VSKLAVLSPSPAQHYAARGGACKCIAKGAGWSKGAAAPVTLQTAAATRRLQWTVMHSLTDERKAVGAAASEPNHSRLSIVRHRCSR
jgi:hypothetical protein